MVYRHPTMDINEYVYKLVDNISKENKTILLLGDFNIELLNYDSHTPTNEFFWIFSPSV